MLKVWGRNNSANVQKAMWCVGELGLEYERVDVGGAFGGLDTPEYKAMNPNSRVPTVEDDDNILWESHSVIRYLALKYGKGTLCPDDLGERQKADRWMDWPHNGLNHHLRTLFFALVRDREKVEPDMAALKSVIDEAGTDLPILDGHLANNDYVAGANFTMGDIPIGCIVNRWYSLPMDRPSHPAIEAWLERIRARPAFREHVLLETG
jgi:glutathione S-transferase